MSVHGPPPNVIVSTVPVSATMTGEHVPDALFLPSSLFSANVGVIVDKIAETLLLTLTLAETAAASRWHSAMGIEVLLE